MTLLIIDYPGPSRYFMGESLMYKIRQVCTSLLELAQAMMVVFLAYCVPCSVKVLDGPF